MTVHAPVQTSEQLGVSNGRMLWRGLVRRCPACAERHTHESWFRMLGECPQCSLKFERIFGHSLGYIGLNIVVTFSAMFAVILVGSLITRPDIAVGPLIAVAVATAVLLPLFFTPASHTTWTAIDLIVRPLEPGEIDPRFIKVDPEGARGSMTPDDVAHLATRVVLPDGLTICLRPILPTDGAMIRDGVDRMSPESRYLRFFAPVDHLDAAQVTYFTQIDYVDHFAWVATLPSDHGDELGLGVARYIRSRSDPGAAETAVAVTDDFHRRGIGSVLLESLAAVALSNGIVSFHLLVHYDNHPMIAAMTELGAVQGENDDYTIVRYVLDLPQLAADVRGTQMWNVFRLVGSATAELRASFTPDD